MKGLIVEKENGYYTVLTSTGAYKKVSQRTTRDIGEEVSINPANSMTRYASFAAALLVVVVLIHSVYGLTNTSKIYGYVTLDVNPSVEFAINARDKVLSAYAFNQEAAVILVNMDYEGRSVQEVLADFTEQAIHFQFITPEKKNRVVISLVLRGKEDKSSESKLKEIKEKQEVILEEARQEAMVETMVLDMEIREQAMEVGISSAKQREANIKEKEDQRQKKQEGVKGPLNDKKPEASQKALPKEQPKGNIPEQGNKPDIAQAIKNQNSETELKGKDKLISNDKENSSKAKNDEDKIKLLPNRANIKKNKVNPPGLTGRFNNNGRGKSFGIGRVTKY